MKSFGRLLFPMMLLQPQASRMFSFEEQKEKYELVGQGFPQDHISFGFIQVMLVILGIFNPFKI